MATGKPSSSSQFRHDHLNFFRSNSFSRWLLGWLVLFNLILISCGAGSTNSTNPISNPATVSVTVSPATSSVDQGDTIQFFATVGGSSNHAVTWSVQEGAAGGSISQSGQYNAPAAAMDVHVVATSVADPSKSFNALVTVKTVSVSMPATAGVKAGQQRQFTAVVAGTVVKDVNWTVEEGSAGGIVTADGLYTAPINGGPFHVTARSVADPSKAATAAVVLVYAGFRMLNTSTLAPRVYHTATLLPNGKVLIAGGLSIGVDGTFGLPVSSAELFDPATETFSGTGAMSAARASHTATLLNNGTVLVAGGLNATAEVYDPATGAFTQVGNMVAERGAHTASLLGDGRVLIAGGNQEGPDAFQIYPVATAEIYDPTTQTFTSVGDIPYKAAWHTASVLLDGRVLVAGGYGSSCPDPQDGTAIFDPASNSFSAGVSLPGGRAEHTATTLNDGRVLITGGAFDDFCGPGLIYDTAVVFDSATSSYSSEKKMREPRHGHSATLLLDGKVLVVDSLAELFDPATSSFAITGDPNVTWTGRLATRLADGRVLFTGSNAVAEIYE